MVLALLAMGWGFQLLALHGWWTGGGRYRLLTTWEWALPNHRLRHRGLPVRPGSRHHHAVGLPLVMVKRLCSTGSFAEALTWLLLMFLQPGEAASRRKQMDVQVVNDFLVADSTESSWGFLLLFVVIVIYLGGHLLCDLLAGWRWLVACCTQGHAKCAGWWHWLRAMEVPDPDLEEPPLTFIRMTATRQRAHLTDRCPSLQASTSYVRETHEICKHCRRLVMEELSHKKKKAG